MGVAVDRLIIFVSSRVYRVVNVTTIHGTKGKGCEGSAGSYSTVFGRPMGQSDGIFQSACGTHSYLTNTKVRGIRWHMEENNFNFNVVTADVPEGASPDYALKSIELVGQDARTRRARALVRVWGARNAGRQLEHLSNSSRQKA
jgi:hypothetical protein